MDPFTMSLLIGGGVGALKNIMGKDQEKAEIASNLAQRQAAARARGVGVNFAIPEEQKERTLLQDALTGAATGANMGQQLGLAKNLINKSWAGDPNTFGGEAFQEMGAGGLSVNPAQANPADSFSEIMGSYGRNTAPSAWDTFDQGPSNYGPRR